MIMTRTPFRMSFAGGGSDLSAFYEKNGYGAVVSTTINKYMYIMIHPYFHDKIRIKYSKTEDVNSVDEIQHPIVRECLRMVNIDRGIEIASIADVPAGTGIGSSSSFTVGLLNALYAFKGESLDKKTLAERACKIEIDILKEPIGKQDQYAASFGGLNYIQFGNDNSVTVESFKNNSDLIRKIEKNLIIFYIGNERKANHILSEQKINMENDDKYLKVKKMVGLADSLKKSFAEGNVDILGKILHEGWKHKRNVASSVSNSRIEQYYKLGLKAGATGGKVLGAGGGGFILFCCDEKNQDNLRKDLGLQELDFNFDTEGSKVIYVD